MIIPSSHPDRAPLDGAVGDTLGPSPWYTVDQARNTAFGEITDDREPLHDDPVWAASRSPFGGTIVYGFFTISLLTRFLRDLVVDRMFGGDQPAWMPINYGFDRLRLPAPVPCGTRVRGQFVVRDIKRRPGGQWLYRLHCVVDIEHQARPAVVGDWLTLWVPMPSDRPASIDAAFEPRGRSE